MVPVSASRAPLAKHSTNNKLRVQPRIGLKSNIALRLGLSSSRNVETEGRLATKKSERTLSVHSDISSLESYCTSNWNRFLYTVRKTPKNMSISLVDFCGQRNM